jgi:hypothetical protein
MIVQKHITSFLNVDLDVYGQEANKLVSILAPFAFNLSNTHEFSTFELNAKFNTIDETIGKFVDVINSLSPPDRAIWNRCERRVLNIGIQGGDEPHAAQFSVSELTVYRLADIKAEITITVYARN